MCTILFQQGGVGLSANAIGAVAKCKNQRDLQVASGYLEEKGSWRKNAGGDAAHIGAVITHSLFIKKSTKIEE